MTSNARAHFTPLLATLAAAGLLFTVGCAQKQEAETAADTAAATAKEGADKAAEAKPTKVRVQLNWVPEPEFGGLYAAVERGIYSEAGLEVEIIKGSAGVPSAQLTASGQVEFGVVTGDEVVKLRAQGAPLVALYAQFVRSPRGIVVHEANPNQTLEALWKSKSRVVLEPGQSYVKWLDSKYGGGELEKVPSSGNLAGFMADKALAQAVYIFAEPVELEKRGVAVRILDVAASGYNPYEAVIATRSAYLKDNADVVKRFVEATRAGWAAYLAEPGPINEVMAKLNPAMSKDAMDISARLATPYIRGEGTDEAALGKMTGQRWQALVDQLVGLGAVKADKAPKGEALFHDL